MINIIVNISLLIVIIIIINTLFYKIPFHLHQVQNKTAHKDQISHTLPHAKRGKTVKTHNST
jgi:hypothetical protein